jgi:hypothetical protein
MVLALALAACGSGGGGGKAPPPPCDCPDRAEPVDLVEPVEVVGDGSPSSCTEAALRDALEALNAGTGGSITFDCGPDEHTITLASRLDVSSDVVVDGGGTITLSGGETTRIFDLDHYVNFVVQNIALEDARADEYGAAIHHPWYGSLKAINVHFENDACTAVGADIGGGAFFAGGLIDTVVSNCTFVGNRGSNGGAIDVNGSNMTIVDSTFIGNEAFGHGGSAEQGGLGGGVYIDGMNRELEVRPFVMCNTVFENNRATVHGSAIFRHSYPGGSSTISSCTFSENRLEGDGTGTGTLYHGEAPLQLLSSTFSHNTTDHHAGAIFISADYPIAITNCTFVGNETPGNGGALFVGVAHVDVTNSTFADHYADYGPAIFCGESCTMTIRNSIFAYNEANDTYDGMACHKTMDGGDNIQWPATRLSGGDDTPCTPGTTFADPLLGDLADNGGPTRTMALDPSSPALGAGHDCPGTDQRGEARSEPCDLGAFEL